MMPIRAVYLGEISELRQECYDPPVVPGKRGPLGKLIVVPRKVIVPQGSEVTIVQFVDRGIAYGLYGVFIAADNKIRLAPADSFRVVAVDGNSTKVPY